MTINVFSIVRNEEFMLPQFLKHYSKYATRIFIIDDHSTDLTAEIAKAHPMVTYLEYGFDGFDEDEFSGTFESMSSIYRADWAVCVDGDEFIHGLETLKDEPSHTVLKTTGYTMIGKTGKLEDCKKIRTKSFDKPVVFDPRISPRFGDGRHTVARDVPLKNSKLELWHYKYPSREYYLKRNTETYPRIMDEKDAAYRLKKGLAWFDTYI